MEKIATRAALALAISITSAGCDPLPTEVPKSFITTNNFYQTADHARSALVAAYNSISAGNLTGWQWHSVLEGHSDLANAHPLDQNPAAHQPNTLQWDNHNVFMVAFWQNGFQGIYRINLALEHIPDSPLPEEEKQVAIGELRFLRAWIYIQYEKRYGGVPLYRTLENHDNTQPVRATREETDAFIIEDLVAAEAVLPARWPAEWWGRITKSAAQMALADIYNWRSSRYDSGEWDQAASWAKRVIDSGEHRLLADQLQVFLSSNKGNDEMIFVRTATGLENRSSSDLQQAYYPREVNPGGGFGLLIPRPWSWESFAEGDYRKEVAFLDAMCNTTGTECFDPLPQGPIGFKYRSNNPAVPGRQDYDIPFYRYAETLLLYAEALNEMGRTAEALEYVNIVRARARKGTGDENRPEPADLPTDLSQFEARDAIYWERHFEMIWEVKRWWDLVRRDTLEPGSWVATMMANNPISYAQGPIEEHRKLWPIPQREVDLSRGSLIQNPGY